HLTCRGHSFILLQQHELGVLWNRRSPRMGSERTTSLTPAEAWALDDLIRHTWTEEGKPVGRGLLLKVFAVIKEFETRRNDGHPPDVLPIALTEEECWTIDFHV